jgi:hypothetical protein
VSPLAEPIIEACAAAEPHPARYQMAVGDVPFVLSGAPDVLAACGFDVFASGCTVLPSGHVSPSGTRTIHVACGPEVAATLPLLPAVDLEHGRRPAVLDDVVIAVRGQPVVIYAVAADRRTGAVWFPGPLLRPQWEFARPLLPAVQAMLRDTPWAVLHAAAVGLGEQTVLLTGGSHAGKSSLALAALQRGGQFFGDDVVAVSAVDGRVRVARVYDTARLRMPPTPGLEALVAHGFASHEDGEARTELRLRPLLAGRAVTAEVTHLVQLQRDGAPAPTFGSVSRAQIISTTTGSTLQVTFGDLAHHATVMAVCRQLRPRRFDPGPDLEAAVAALGDWLAVPSQ